MCGSRLWVYSTQQRHDPPRGRVSLTRAVVWCTITARMPGTGIRGDGAAQLPPPATVKVPQRSGRTTVAPIRHVASKPTEWNSK